MPKNANFINRFKWPLIIVAVIAGIIFFGQRALNSSDQTGSSQNTVNARVQKGNLTSSISASGKVATANYLAVTTSVNGIVKKVYVKEGDKVAAGQKLMDVTLDSEGEKSRLSSYAAYLKAAQAVKEAQQSIPILEAAVFQKDAAFKDVKESNSYQTRDERVSYSTAESAYNQAKNDLANKKANLTNLQVSLSNAWLDYQSQSSTITSPSDGIVASVLAVEGAKIENSVSERSIQTVAAIKKEGTPIASLNIGEVDINNIKVGQKVTLTLNSLSDQRVTGTVAGIDKVGTSTSGVTNYPVTVKFDQASDQILPNMNVQADIIMQEKNDVLYVPTAAIQNAQGKKTVKVIRNGNIEEVEVKTGISDTNNTEITEGLNEGEEVQVNTLPTSGFTTGQNQGQNRNVQVFGGFGGGGAGFVRR